MQLHHDAFLSYWHAHNSLCNGFNGLCNGFNSLCNGFNSLLYTGSKSDFLDTNPKDTPVSEYPPLPGSHPPSDPDTADAPSPPSYDQAMQQVQQHATLPQPNPHAAPASGETARAPQGSSPRSKSPSGKEGLGPGAAAGVGTAASAPGGSLEAIDRSAEEALQIQASVVVVL